MKAKGSISLCFAMLVLAGSSQLQAEHETAFPYSFKEATPTGQTAAGTYQPFFETSQGWFLRRTESGHFVFADWGITQLLIVEERDASVKRSVKLRTEVPGVRTWNCHETELPGGRLLICMATQQDEPAAGKGSMSILLMIVNLATGKMEVAKQIAYDDPTQSGRSKGAVRHQGQVCVQAVMAGPNLRVVNNYFLADFDSKTLKLIRSSKAPSEVPVQSGTPVGAGAYWVDYDGTKRWFFAETGKVAKEISKADSEELEAKKIDWQSGSPLFIVGKATQGVVVSERDKSTRIDTGKKTLEGGVFVQMQTGYCVVSPATQQNRDFHVFKSTAPKAP